MKRHIIAVLAILALLCLPGLTLAGTGLVIVYTGNSYGQYLPCPS